MALASEKPRFRNKPISVYTVQKNPSKNNCNTTPVSQTVPVERGFILLKNIPPISEPSPFQDEKKVINFLIHTCWCLGDTLESFLSRSAL